MNKYLIIDNNGLSRKTITYFLNQLHDQVIAEEYHSIEQAIGARVLEQSYEGLIVNENAGCIETLLSHQQLDQAYGDVKLIFILSNIYQPVIQNLVSKGVAAILTTDCGQSEFLEVLKLKSNSLTYVSPAVLEKLTQPVQNVKHKNGLLNKLTQRQAEVLDCIKKGYANKLIAHELGLSEGTVKLHVSSILKALKATNRTEAALKASTLSLEHA